MSLNQIVFIFIICITNLKTHAQHYDIGHDTDYLEITNQHMLNNNLRILFTLSHGKTIQKVFNSDFALIEELVFMEGELVAGIEYFPHPIFPFLETPRSFSVQNIAQLDFNQDLIKKKYILNIKNLASLQMSEDFRQVKYETFYTRVYKQDDNRFFIHNPLNVKSKKIQFIQ